MVGNPEVDCLLVSVSVWPVNRERVFLSPLPGFKTSISKYDRLTKATL